MTQGRIGGPMLRDNLVRNGIDLAVETDLLYFDVNNMRIGINKAVPDADLDVDGTTRLANIQVSSNTISTINSNGNLTLSPNGTGNVILNTSTANRVIYAGPNKQLLTSANLTFDGSELSISTANSTIVKAGNIQISANTITSIDTNGNIVLNPSGTGNVILDHVTANRITYTGPNKEILTNANLTFEGSTLVLTGVANIDNIQIDGNTISSRNSNGNIILNPDGTGTVNIDYLSFGRIPYASTNGSLVDSANLTFDGTNLYVSGLSINGALSLGNLDLSGNTISSVNTNGNIELDPNGSGQVKVTGTNALTLPVGTLVDRPSGTIGDIRVNSDSGYLEYFDGTNWQIITGDSTTIVNDSFNGDGSTVNFTLSQAGTSSSTFVSVNGVVQKPGTAYTVSGTTLSFVEAPQTGDSIDTRTLQSVHDITAILDTSLTRISVSNTAQVANITLGGTLSYTIGNAAILPGANLTYDLGSSSLRWDNVYAGSLFDSLGNVRDLPQNAKSALYSLQVTDNGKHISTNSNVTIPNSVFSSGNTITVYNDSALSITLVQDTGVTLRLAGTASTGDRTLAQYGVANILCVSPNVFVVGGDGIS